MRRSIATLLLLVLPLTACHTWAAPELQPDAGLILVSAAVCAATGCFEIGGPGSWDE